MSFKRDVMFLHTLTEKDIAKFIINNCKDVTDVKSVSSIAALPPSENQIINGEFKTRYNARTVFYIRFIDESRKAKYFRFVIIGSKRMHPYSNRVSLSAEKAYRDFEDHVYYANGNIRPNAIRMFICWGGLNDDR